MYGFDHGAAGSPEVWLSLNQCHGLRGNVYFMPAFEPLGDRVQSGIAAALCLDFRDSGQNVVQVRSGSAMSPAHEMDLVLKTKASGILGMAAIDHVDEGCDVA